MCEYCGCRGVPPIGELMDEHHALVDQAHHIRHDLGEGDRATGVRHLLDDLDVHVERVDLGSGNDTRDRPRLSTTFHTRGRSNNEEEPCRRSH